MKNDTEKMNAKNKMKYGNHDRLFEAMSFHY
jgi:hypothetical protein